MRACGCGCMWMKKKSSFCCRLRFCTHHFPEHPRTHTFLSHALYNMCYSIHVCDAPFHSLCFGCRCCCCCFSRCSVLFHVVAFFLCSLPFFSLLLFFFQTVNGLHFTIQITSYRVRDDDNNDKGTQQKTPMINFVHVKHSFSHCTTQKMYVCVCVFMDSKKIKCIQFFFLHLATFCVYGGTLRTKNMWKNSGSRAKQRILHTEIAECAKDDAKWKRARASERKTDKKERERKRRWESIELKAIGKNT